MQYDLIFNSNIPLAKVYTTATASILDIEYQILLSFSHGNTHITSSKPNAAASINPNYFMLDFDLDVQVAAAEFIRNVLMTTEPIASQVTAETSPGTSVLASNADDAMFGKYIKSAFSNNFHPVGTTAMIPRDLGGNVNESLKVCGASNVRVVDASVLPFQVCGYMTSTRYAVAERAAD